MSRDAWVRHYERRLIEANKVFPTASQRTREAWAECMAAQDDADEEAERADRLVDAAKDKCL